MMKSVASFTILLQVLPLLTNATSLPSVNPKEVAIIDGRRYYFSSIAVTVSEAITLCQELNMTLAGLETQQEFEAITEYIAVNLAANTALFLTSGTLQLNMWVWSNVGKPVSYFKWATAEPDLRTDELGLCVEEKLMWDCFVTASIRFICEETTSC